MPADLKDPEGFQPFYYDKRYDDPKGPFDAESINIDEYLQSIAIEELGTRLNKEKMESLKRIMEYKGFFHRNIGDESFRNEMKNQIRILKLARRIINARSK
jgi:hypothetical protein